MRSIEEDDEILQDRIKLLLFADAEGWTAANIYHGHLECGSDSEDEKKDEDGI